MTTIQDPKSTMSAACRTMMRDRAPHEPKPLVIYHDDCADGFTAAWVVWLVMRDRAEYRAARYGDPIPSHVEGRDVLIVDFSYKRPQLIELSNQCRTLYVLDHHKTAQADLEGIQGCVFDMNESGASMALEAFWDPIAEKDMFDEVVEFVGYVKDRDLWRWQLRASKEINAFIGTIRRDFKEWTNVCLGIGGEEDEFDFCVSRGVTALNAIERYCEDMAERAVMGEVDGYLVPIVNTSHATSEVVGMLAEGHSFAVGWFVNAKGKVKFSLRSRGENAVDVSVIASKYGGGGHRNAASFNADLQQLISFIWYPGETVRL